LIEADGGSYQLLGGALKDIAAKLKKNVVDLTETEFRSYSGMLLDTLGLDEEKKEASDHWSGLVLRLMAHLRRPSNDDTTVLQLSRSGKRSLDSSDLSSLRTKKPEAFNLLSLLFHISEPDCPIETWLLAYGGRATRTKWSSTGGLQGFEACELGLSPQMQNLLKGDLEYNLRILQSSQCIRVDGTKIRVESTTGCELEQILDYQTRDYWQNQALLLACYFFTGCQYSVQ